MPSLREAIRTACDLLVRYSEGLLSSEQYDSVRHPGEVDMEAARDGHQIRLDRVAELRALADAPTPLCEMLVDERFEAGAVVQFTSVAYAGMAVQLRKVNGAVQGRGAEPCQAGGDCHHWGPIVRLPIADLQAPTEFVAPEVKA